jgi:hypothetical protein
MFHSRDALQSIKCLQDGKASRLNALAEPHERYRKTIERNGIQCGFGQDHGADILGGAALRRTPPNLASKTECTQ